MFVDESTTKTNGNNTHPLDTLRRHTDKKHKGDRFEELTEGYLHKIYGATNIKRQTPDRGVDRWFTDNNGRRCAAQMKCLDASSSVSMRDVTQFVEAAASDGGADSLVLLTTGRVSREAQKVIDRHGITVHCYDDLVRWDGWDGRVGGSVELPLFLRNYQAEAVAACCTVEPLGKIIMATGLGKTVVQAGWFAVAGSCLLMVPSMTLARQSVRVLQRQLPGRSVLVVYSGEDVDGGPVPAEATTDSEQIRQYLAATERPIVVATYQSGRAVVEGAAGFVFDRVAYDEAHRTASPNSGLFQITLTGVAAKQRRFFTATPRIHEPDLRSTIMSTGKISYSMDDAALYGPVLYEKTLVEGINEGWLAPLDIVAGLITDTDIAALIDRNRWTDVLDSIDAVYDVASVLFTLKQARDEGIRRVLTFHGSVRKAQRAAKMFARAAREIGMTVNVVSVHSGSRQAARDEAAAMLDDPSSINIVCNCRLFGEGIDAPALDAVVFFDPSKSTIKIAQNIGRATRLHPTKERARIIIPVYTGDAATAEEMVENSRWDKLYFIASTLKTLEISVQQVEQVVESEGKRIIGNKEAPIRFFPVATEHIDLEAVAAATESIILHGTWDNFGAKIMKLTKEQQTVFLAEFAAQLFSNPEILTSEQIEVMLNEEIDKVVT